MSGAGKIYFLVQSSITRDQYFVIWKLPPRRRRPSKFPTGGVLMASEPIKESGWDDIIVDKYF